MIPRDLLPAFYVLVALDLASFVYGALTRDFTQVSPFITLLTSGILGILGGSVIRGRGDHTKDGGGP